MPLDEELLERVAQDGFMQYDRWPEQLEPLLQRLDEIVLHEFPVLKVPQDLVSSYASQPSSSYLIPESLQSSSNKENATPATNQISYNNNSLEYESTNSDLVPNTQISQLDSSSLPPQLLSLLASIKSTLRTYFAHKPPHTAQRLAELILRPTRQYRTLPAYLRAVDRVVSVSSSADIFPLPRTGAPAEGELTNGISNGTSSGFMVTDESLGSDESLGGALLTPIPWLSNPDLDAVRAEMIAEGAIPLRTDAAVTQGELIRQEQEAGLIANSQTPPHSTKPLGEDGEDGERTSPQPEEIPHARGPSVLGVEDLGLQDGKGVQMVLSDPNKSQEGGGEKDGMDVSVSAAAEPPSNEQGSEQPNNNRDPDAEDDDIILDDITANQVTASTSDTEKSAETGSEHLITERNETG